MCHLGRRRRWSNIARALELQIFLEHFGSSKKSNDTYCIDTMANCMSCSFGVNELFEFWGGFKKLPKVAPNIVLLIIDHMQKMSVQFDG